MALAGLVLCALCAVCCMPYAVCWLASCVKEEEWQRNPPPLPGGAFVSRPSPADGVGGRCVSSVVCSVSSSGSIFDTGGGSSAGGGERSGSIPASGSSNSSSDGSSSGGGGGGGCGGSIFNSGCTGGVIVSNSSDRGPGPGGVDHAQSSSATLGRIASGGCGGGLVWGEEGHGGGALDGGGREREQRRVKGKGKAETPAAWPPGGLGEGEGLRIDDLPDVSVTHIQALCLWRVSVWD